VQDGCLHLDKAALVEIAPDPCNDPAAEDEVATRLLIDEQVEVALPVARLGIDETMESVRQGPLDLGEKLELVDGKRRLASPRPRGNAHRSDEIAKVHVRRPRSVFGAEKLQGPGAIDEVEKGQFPVSSPAQNSPGHASGLRALPAGVETVGLRPDRRDLVPIGKALRPSHRERV
jgi:hypothetical protein